MSKKLIRKKQKKIERDKAKEHIEELFAVAKAQFPSALSKNAVKTALNYSTKYKVPIPKDLKRSFCKNCYSLLISEKTARIRFKSGKTPLKIITCKHCGAIKRIGWTKQVKKKQEALPQK